MNDTREVPDKLVGLEIATRAALKRAMWIGPLFCAMKAMYDSDGHVDDALADHVGEEMQMLTYELGAMVKEIGKVDLPL